MDWGALKRDALHAGSHDFASPLLETLKFLVAHNVPAADFDNTGE